MRLREPVSGPAEYVNFALPGNWTGAEMIERARSCASGIGSKREVITYEAVTPQPGIYELLLEYDENCSGADEAAYTITVENNGEIETFRGTMDEASGPHLSQVQLKRVGTFTYVRD